MCRVMAVPWMPVATSVPRTTPTLTTQQVLTCGKHPVTRSPGRAASHMDYSTGIKELLGKALSFVPLIPQQRPLRVSWTFYSTVIPEAMRVSWTFHPTVTPKVLRVSWTFHPSHPTVIPKATSISRTFHPPHPTVTPTPILYSMWESWALPEGETGLWVPWDESRLWKGPSSCWKGHKDWGGHVVPPSLDLTSMGLSLLSLSTSNEPDTRSCLENSGNWCQQQGTLPGVSPAGNWGSGMHKHPRMWGVSGDLDIVPSPPGFPAIPMSSSQLTRIPSQKRIPLATGREGFLCSDAVRMIPKQMWTIPVKMWMVWGRMRERDPNPVAVRRIPPQSHITMLGRDWDRHLSQCPLHSAGQSLRIPSPWKAASHPQHLGMSPLEALHLE